MDDDDVKGRFAVWSISTVLLMIGAGAQWGVGAAISALGAGGLWLVLIVEINRRN